MARKKARKSTELPRIGLAVREARLGKGWIQAYLASLAGVSSRTIYLLETGERATTRADVIIRLATALGEDIKVWLDYAERSASDQTIELHKRRVQSNLDFLEKGKHGVQGYGEIGVDAFFDQLAEIADNGIICVYYTMTPGALLNPTVMMRITERVNAGLFLAMIIPYGTVPKESTEQKINLADFYVQVEKDVVILARNLLKRVKKERKNRIRVFCPQFPSGEERMQYIIPPIPFWEIRPMLTRRASTEKSFGSDDEEYRLYTWMTSIDRTSDKIYEFYSTEHHNISKFLWSWREFLSDILEPWLNAKGDGWGRLSKNSIWQKKEIPEETKETDIEPEERTQGI